MNVDKQASKIFDAWELETHDIDSTVIRDIRSALEEALRIGYNKGVKRSQMMIKASSKLLDKEKLSVMQSVMD
jgi:hypothetical protein